jgi:hypothetical protein
MTAREVDSVTLRACAWLVVTVPETPLVSTTLTAAPSAPGWASKLADRSITLIADVSVELSVLIEDETSETEIETLSVVPNALTITNALDSDTLSADVSVVVTVPPTLDVSAVLIAAASVVD